MAIKERDCGRWGTVNVGDGWDRLVGKREVPEWTEMVEGHGSRPLSGGTAWEATGGGSGRSRVAGDGVDRRPSCVGRNGGVGRRAGLGTRLRTRWGADVAGRESDGVEKFRVPSAGLALPTAAEIAALGDE